MSKTLFRHNCEFVTGAVSIEGIPRTVFPEVAFAGRSNVGKSSLLNALVKNKNLARTSKTPGRTKEINFFLLDKKLMLVDLPGYGYARAGKREVEGWNRLIRDYLVGRAALRQVYILIDSRHGIKTNDEEIMSMLDEAAVSYRIVLTKADKKLKMEIGDMDTLAIRHTAMHPDVIITSSKERLGIDQLQKVIIAHVKK